jgi:cytoplasmic iron level regulating protein YaaA (DUF328/UPF0246 family)
MLIVISPAKSLDFETPASVDKYTEPAFLKESSELVSGLKKLGSTGLSELMHISEKLGDLNAERYKKWKKPFTPKNAKQAVLAFTGDVYTGLEAHNFTQKEHEFAQKHLRILSGLYGLLKPLDLMQPYRLEMGTSLENKKGKDLYSFWGTKIAEVINQEMRSLKSEALVNLASQEYFKVFPKDSLEFPVVTPVFKDKKNGQYKIISFFAKKARGMMAQHIIKNKITKIEDIKTFSSGGYGWNASLSKGSEWVFTRDTQG